VVAKNEKSATVVALVPPVGREIGVGSVVALKSGGVAMTVDSIEDDVAALVWHSEDGTMQYDTVHIATLRHLPTDAD
jgi:uncharacterized protein YodC (DUF2158 family)